ncbi:hypothetical protein ANCCAN_26872 [Ancylostoma caninum]|uniref:Uncharacterized protein n=1 Tax=Ancylostoma caninum TaxID=29170 RepID=A0A368F5P0_ANCCA|nr:hypothetical protein ANCCAN_26872 [Ancylostoma caninum]
MNTKERLLSGADVLATSSINEPHRIIKELNELTNSNVTDTGCHVKLWKGFRHALQLDLPAGSLIEVFLTSTDDSDNVDQVEMVYEKIRHLYINVNVFLSHATFFKPSGFACNATQVAHTIPLQYQNAEVYRQRSDHCGQTVDVYFPVDAYTQTIQLNTLGYQKYVRIYDGNVFRRLSFCCCQNRKTQAKKWKNSLLQRILNLTGISSTSVAASS